MEIILVAADPLPKESTDSKEGGNLMASLAICAAILFVSIWLMLRGRLLKSRNQSCSAPGAPVEPSPADEAHIKHIAQTYETVREMTGRLDTKIRVLDALIRDADRAAARLEAAQRGEAPPTQPKRVPESCVDEIYFYSDYGFSTSDIASRLGVPVESVEQILGDRE
ncbi:MAG: hypothetical protein PVH19_04655 [Planctomycetia bacterium]|jgi:hypothetical protein